MENWSMSWSMSDLVEEDWSISDIFDEDWCLPEIKEALKKRKRIKRERERLTKKPPLSVAEMEKSRQEALRVIAACGLYPEEGIKSAQDRERQMGCKILNILTERATTGNADVGQSLGGGGSSEETLANAGPDE